eukprot:SAG22_NODE_15810_length_340_cov_0.643154_1_plen_57_part_10
MAGNTGPLVGPHAKAVATQKEGWRGGGDTEGRMERRWKHRRKDGEAVAKQKAVQSER